MKNDRLEDVNPGDPISASAYNVLLRTVRQFQGLKSGFMSGGSVSTRRDMVDDSEVYKLINCEDETDTLFVANDLAENIDRVVVVQGTCYIVTEPDDEDDCVIPICVTIQAELDDCKECKDGGNAACWLFTPCTTGSAFIVDNRDFGKYNGKIVRWNDDLCYTVTPSDTCTGSIAGTDDDVKATFAACSECEWCVKLTSCFDDTVKYIRRDTFGFPDAAVNRVMKIDGECFLVVDVEFVCGVNPEEVDWDGIFYDDCPTCGCHEFSMCTGPDPNIFVHKATWFTGGAAFDLDSLGVGDVITYGSPTLPTCIKYEGVTNDPVGCDTSIEIEVVNEYDNCDCCTGWKLTECSPGLSELYVNSGDDLCPFYLGETKAVVKRAAGSPDDLCYDTIVKVPLDELQSWEEFLVDVYSDTCPQCQDPVFSLLDIGCASLVCGNCGGGGTEDTRYTDEDLADVVGKLIKYDGICWIVGEAPGETVTDPTPIEWVGPFDDCGPCLEAPTCIEVVVDIDWTNKKVKKQKYVIALVKCDESEDTIPTAPCP